MAEHYEWVTREYRKPGFSAETEARIQREGGSLSGYGFFRVMSVLLKFVFKTTNAAYYAAPLAYNPGYTHFVDRLKKKGFVELLWMRGIYHDYPKLISYFIKAVGKYDDPERPTVASSMVLPEVGHDEAFSKAIGELLERDAARAPDSGWDTLKTRHLPLPFPIEDIPHFSYAQIQSSKRYVQKGDEGLFKSIKVKNVTTGGSAWLPQQYIYYGNGTRSAHERVLYEPTTSGCGGGFTFGQAALSALCEFIERDHFMLWWFSGLAPRRITLPHGDMRITKKVEEARRRFGLEVYFLDTSYDTGLLSVVCIIIDPKLSIVGLGGKAGVHKERVLEAAYSEALTLLHSTRTRIDGGSKGDAFFKENDFTDMSMSQMERETQCCTPAAVEYIKKTFLAGVEVPYEKIAVDAFDTKSDEHLFYSIVKRYNEHADIRHLANHIFLYEFDSKWLRECDYRVVRIVIPSFLKLHLREAYATPHSRRLNDFCTHHGIPKSDFVINTVPHFFP